MGKRERESVTTIHSNLSSYGWERNWVDDYRISCLRRSPQRKSMNRMHNERRDTSTMSLWVFEGSQLDWLLKFEGIEHGSSSLFITHDGCFIERAFNPFQALFRVRKTWVWARACRATSRRNLSHFKSDLESPRKEEKITSQIRTWFAKFFSDLRKNWAKRFQVVITLNFSRNLDPTRWHINCEKTCWSARTWVSGRWLSAER